MREQNDCIYDQHLWQFTSSQSTVSQYLPEFKGFPYTHLGIGGSGQILDITGSGLESILTNALRAED